MILNTSGEGETGKARMGRGYWVTDEFVLNFEPETDKALVICDVQSVSSF